MANEVFAIHVKWDSAGLSKWDRYLETHQGRMLERLIDNAMGKALRPLAAAIKASELASGIHNTGRPVYGRLRKGETITSALRTGRLLKSIKVRKLRKRPGEVSAWAAGPTDHVAHLVIRGHEIVTPGGTDLGRRTRAFPFVNGPVDAEGHLIQAQLSSDVWASSIRPL